MPVWNEKRVQDFVTGLGKGVKGASIEELLGFLLGLALLIFFVLWLQKRSDERKSRMAIERSRALFNSELDNRALPPSAVQLMEDLAYEMSVSSREAEIHRLFQDSSLFDQFARILIQENPDLQRPLRLLKPILGLGHGFSGQMTESTEEIPEETEVFFDVAGHTMAGLVAANHSRGLLVRPHTAPGLDSQQKADFKVGMEGELRWQRKGVFYSAKCRILSLENNAMALDHSEVLQARHRRQFLRTGCNLSATLAGQRIRITDIGGGGFFTPSFPVPRESIRDDQNEIVPSRGEEAKSEASPETDVVYRCSIDLEKMPVHCLAGLVRSDDDGQHFSFRRIRPGDQDRIVQFVLKSERNAQT
ncbi:MAG: hypothetical protein KDK25_03815 [Leptospiraceae bacterium]|nr:hypothetical protein [Leptospiraceae bacterium]